MRRHRQAPVLRYPAFGDVHLGHDLKAADNPVVDAARRAHHLVQNPVDPEPHQQIVFVGFEVDVTGTILDPLGDQQVDELDDGGILDNLVQRLEVLLVVLQVHRGREVVQVGVGAIHTVDSGIHVVAHGDNGAHIHPRQGADIVAGDDVCRIGHGQDQEVVLDADGQHVMAPAHGSWQPSDGVAVDDHIAEVDERHADLGCQCGN